MLVINEETGCRSGRRRRHVSSKGQHSNQSSNDQHNSRSSQESSGSLYAGSTSGTGGSGRDSTSRHLFHANKHQVGIYLKHYLRFKFSRFFLKTLIHIF